MRRIVLNLLLCTMLIGAMAASVIAQEVSVKAEQPVLVTSCGQSPGPLKLKIFLKRLKYDYVYDLHATAESLKKGANEKVFKSIIIVTGASLKGMGAAGVSIKDELDRIKPLIEEAKKQKILIIAAHVEGMARRSQGAGAGDNSDEISIDTVCPHANLLMVRSDGNEDKRFTEISVENNIPLIEFEKNTAIGTLLKKLYE